MSKDIQETKEGTENQNDSLKLAAEEATKRAEAAEKKAVEEAQKNEDLKLELKALKASKEVEKGPVKIEVPDKKERTFKVDEQDYCFIEQAQVWWEGNKRLVKDLVKDEDICKAMVDNKSILIHKIQ